MLALFFDTSPCMLGERVLSKLDATTRTCREKQRTERACWRRGVPSASHTREPHDGHALGTGQGPAMLRAHGEDRWGKGLSGHLQQSHTLAPLTQGSRGGHQSSLVSRSLVYRSPNPSLHGGSDWLAPGCRAKGFEEKESPCHKENPVGHRPSLGHGETWPRLDPQGSEGMLRPPPTEAGPGTARYTLQRGLCGQGTPSCVSVIIRAIITFRLTNGARFLSDDFWRIFVLKYNKLKQEAFTL